MKPKNPEPFAIRTLDDLRTAAARLGREIALSRNFELPGQPLRIHGVTVPNRLCVQPLEGCDADERGAPAPLTLRRYRRFAEGGFGMIWLEAAAVADEGRANARQLRLQRSNAGAFAQLVAEIREAARLRWNHEIVLILQLSHAGRYSRPGLSAGSPAIGADSPCAPPSDDALDRLQDAYAATAALALEAGFDGVDIKACYGDLPSELLRAVDRPGRYGGSPENRSRFLREVVGRVSQSHPQALTASRIAVAPGAAGAAATANLARELRQAGARLLNLAPPDGDAAAPPDTGALENFFVLTDALRAVVQAAPALAVVAGGLSWFRQFLPDVAAGVLESCGAAMIGVGRAALANPALAGELLRTGRIDPERCCIDCDACTQLVRDDGHSGCAIMDSAVYGAEYLNRRRIAPDHLREEARRCRNCEPAPCRDGCPARIDVPAFIGAFADGALDQAYDILRTANVLPGMCAHLCPVHMLCEGRCAAAILDGTPIPIHDIQYAVCREAWRSGGSAIAVPAQATHKKIAVVGAGPAGVACAAKLLEQGHQVVIYERAARAGGTPELLIRAERFCGAREEIETLLKPALCGGRLIIRFGTELGRNLSLDELRRESDAVFLAAGVWHELSLGSADGVVSGIDFLSRYRSGRIAKVPERVILLAGGDSAMDCAKAALELGARTLLILYAGALAQMHWHMADSWFRTEGVHFVTLTRPLGYCAAPDGGVVGVRVRRSFGTASEDTLSAGMVIEAMGLGVEPALQSALNGLACTPEGLVQTAADSFACELPGVFAGGGLINGGASVVQCVAEGMRAAREIGVYLNLA